MQANDILEYGDKAIKAFRDGAYDAAYDCVLKDVSQFIKKIESMAENINLSLFHECFKPSPVDYAKYLINLKDTEENKEFVTEAKNTISDLKKHNKKYERKIIKKKKNADETLEIIEKVLDYNKNAQKNFPLASKVDKGKSVPKKQ